MSQISHDILNGKREAVGLPLLPQTAADQPTTEPSVQAAAPLPAPAPVRMLDAAGQSVRAGNVVAYSGYVRGDDINQRMARVIDTRKRPLGDGTEYWVADIVVDDMMIVANELQIVRVGPLDAVVTAVRDLVAELEETGDYDPYALLRRALDGGI